MTILTTFLGIVESALQNPSDKAAVKIAIDGIAAWKDIASRPMILQLEADIGAYVALLPKAGAPTVDPPSDQQPNADYAGAHGKLMPPGM
jgi:hypothetical protein